MEKLMEHSRTILAVLGTGFTFAFGGWDMAIKILVVFVVIDYVTGLLKSFINKNLSSYVGFKGITKKALIFVILILAVCLDRLLNTGTWLFRTMVCYFFIANEGISILENCGQMGVPIPKKLLDTLTQLKNKNDEGSDDNGTN